PVHMVEQVKQFARATQAYVQEYGREPSPEELADKLCVSLVVVRQVSSLVKDPVSIDAPLGEDGSFVIGDFVADENAVSPFDAACDGDRSQRARVLLETLTPREAKILRMRFGIGERDAQ